MPSNSAWAQSFNKLVRVKFNFFVLVCCFLHSLGFSLVFSVALHLLKEHSTTDKLGIDAETWESQTLYQHSKNDGVKFDYIVVNYAPNHTLVKGWPKYGKFLPKYGQIWTQVMVKFDHTLVKLWPKYGSVHSWLQYNQIWPNRF